MADNPKSEDKGQKSKSLINFFIVGAQKAGSTHLQLVISEHPDVYIPKQEIADFENPKMSRKAVGILENKLSIKPDVKKIGIKRPNYLYIPLCATNIQKYNPEAKILIILRNPIDRALSAYYHNMRMGLMPITESNVGFTKLLGRGGIINYPRTKNILKYGLYYEHVKRYLEVFPEKNVKIVLLKDLQKRPIKTIKSIYSFLNVNPNYKPSNIKRRHMEGVYSLKRLRLLTLENPFIYYSRGHKGVLAKKMSFTDYLMVVLIRSLDFIFTKPLFGNEKPILNKNIKQKLRHYYKEDVKNLQKLIKRDLNYWSIY